ncbi:hypothetical protein ACF0H5_008659 [Mactra antiquata]
MAFIYFILSLIMIYSISHVTADHPKEKLDKQPKGSQVGCTKLVFEGKGDFRLQKKIYQPQNAQHYIESLTLLKRTSFYRCEPVNEKYGISEDGHSWWVDRGCEAIFEVVECPNNGQVPPPDTWKRMYEELRRRLREGTQNLDLTNFNLNGVFSRFENPRPIVGRNQRL